MNNRERYPSEALNTFVNPIRLPEIPRGTDDWFRYIPEAFTENHKPEGVTSPDYRSMADPTVKYFDGKWYLYSSYGMAWVTEDFDTWKHVPTEPYNPKYAPTVTKWHDRYLMTSSQQKGCLYVADTPVGPFKKLGKFRHLDGTEFCGTDPDLFTDDDGRLYLYAYGAEKDPNRDRYIGMTVGFELDADDPCQVIRGPIEIFRMHPETNYWERYGRHFQYKHFGWVEGPQMIKKNGRYYLIYTSPGTMERNYCQAVYYSDTSPLEGFVCQKRNPLTIHTEGIVGGAGHGSVVEGPCDTLWAFYTIAMPFMHEFERRVGMDLIAIDEYGELYAPHGVTDTPQYIPSFSPDPVSNNAPELYNVTGELRPVASSTAAGRDALYATDESALTFWQPADDDREPTLTVNLKYPYLLSAVRLFWRDVGLDYESGAVPAPYKYVLEGKINREGGDWFTLIDRSESNEEYNIDYQTFDTAYCDYVRLRITGWGKGLRPAVIDFAVFGRCED